jgi:hypothetical protein
MDRAGEWAQDAPARNTQSACRDGQEVGQRSPAGGSTTNSAQRQKYSSLPAEKQIPKPDRQPTFAAKMASDMAAEVDAGMASDGSLSGAAASMGADTHDDMAASIEHPPTTSIYSALSTLCGSDKFADMTIRCGGREFKAHRAIVCPQSSFFDRALSGGFAVSRLAAL